MTPWSGRTNPCAVRCDAAQARTHGILVENIHLVERGDVGHGDVDPCFTARKSAATMPGNVYYRDKKNSGRRWVIYDGANDGSRTPPDWQLWLRGTIDDLPGRALPPARKFQQKHTPNLTGTMAAFRPDGAHWVGGKVRPASTGDYEPWIPE